MCVEDWQWKSISHGIMYERKMWSSYYELFSYVCNIKCVSENEMGGRVKWFIIAFKIDKFSLNWCFYVY